MLTRREFHQLVAASGLGMAAGSLTGCSERRELPDAESVQGMTIGMIAKSQSNPVF